MLDAVQPVDSFPDLSALLQPKSIAVIGASDRPGNLGGTALRYLQKFGFPGDIWPVNPNQSSVAGLPCFATPKDLPGPADLAILAVSAGAIADMVQDCADAGILNGIVWAGGFAEVGGEGIARQQHLAEVCRRTGFKLCGPNCIGIVNSNLPMTASFASQLLDPDTLFPGNISMVSQSGGMAANTQVLAQQAGFGLRYVISSGNEAVLNAVDFIHALVRDPQTKVIAAYLEGVGDGARFLTVLEQARAARKPVIILKGGATAASARAAVAHTGALVGDDRVWDTIFREQAVIRVHSHEEMLDVAMFLSGMDLDKLPAGNGVAAMTFGGGTGVLSADQCALEGLATPSLEPASRECLKKLMPPIASLANPIDLTPETYNQPQWLELFPKALDVIAADPNVQTLFFQCGGMAHRAQEVIDNICGIRERTQKTVCVFWALAPDAARKRLAAEGIYVFPEVARGVRAIGHAVRFASALLRPARARQVALPDFDWSAHVDRPLAGAVISENQCHAILAAAGLPVAAGRLAVTEDDMVRAAHAVGYPVALKGISATVPHRTAAGLLELDVRSDGEARHAHRRIAERAKRARVDLDGVYVQQMVKGRLELLVSAFRDPTFGVMVSCGAGGNLTEVIADVTLERAPVDEVMALRMLDRLRIVRGAKKLGADADPRHAARFVAGFSRLAATAPWARFVFEVNPIKWGRDGVAAVDGLLVVEKP